MPQHTCEHAYRKPRNPNVFCKLIDRDPYCGHVYFCRITGRTENTEQALKCGLKRRKEENKHGI